MSKWERNASRKYQEGKKFTDSSRVKRALGFIRHRYRPKTQIANSVYSNSSRAGGELWQITISITKSNKAYQREKATFREKWPFDGAHGRRFLSVSTECCRELSCNPVVKLSQVRSRHVTCSSTDTGAASRLYYLW